MKEQKPSGEEIGLQIRLSQILNDHTAPVRTVRFSPDKSTLVSSDGDHMVFWEKKGHLFHQSQELDLPSSQVRFSLGGERLAVVGVAPAANRHLPSVSTVHLCNSLGEESSLVPLAFNAHALAFDPDNQFLAIGDWQGGIHLWGLQEQKLLTELQKQHNHQCLLVI
jgi:WD40 repeat protein